MKRHYLLAWITEGVLVILLIICLSLLIQNLLIYSNIKDTKYKIETNINGMRVGHGLGPPVEISFQGKTYHSISMHLVVGYQAEVGSKLSRRQVGNIISKIATYDRWWSVTSIYELKGISPDIGIAIQFGDEYIKYANKDYYVNYKEIKTALISFLSLIIIAAAIVIIYVKLIRRKKVIGIYPGDYPN